MDQEENNNQFNPPRGNPQPNDDGSYLTTVLAVSAAVVTALGFWYLKNKTAAF